MNRTKAIKVLGLLQRVCLRPHSPASRSGCTRSFLASRGRFSFGQNAVRRRFSHVAGSEVVAGVVKSPHPDVEIPDNTGLSQYLLERVHRHPNDDVAFLNGESGQKWTYGELSSSIQRVCSALVRAGLRRGDVVTMFSPNCPEFAVVYLAVLSMGAIASTVNPLYTTDELAHALSDAGARLLFTIPQLAPISRDAVKKCKNVQGIITVGEAEGCRPLSDLLADDGSLFPENIDFASDDVAALPYSSGTTGLPKGVMLTHKNILANIIQLNQRALVWMEKHDTLMGILPFFHIYGQVVIMLSGIKKGCKTVTMSKFDPGAYLTLIQKEKATYLYVVPPIALFLAKHPVVDKFDLTSVRNIIVGAAPIAGHVIQEVLERLQHIPGLTFRQGYGLTETSPVTHFTLSDNRKYDSIGPLFPNTECKIVDIISGDTLDKNKEGELWIRGPQVMKGYLGNPQATADTINSEGWLRTGDVGYYDEEEEFFITDRLKELIKVKGFQVAPAELEALLVKHPAVQDAGVIGVPDERSGEVPRAYVVLKENKKVSEQDIQEYVKGHVAPYKVLAGGVEFRSEIPKSAAGKILRRILKDQYK